MGKKPTLNFEKIPKPNGGPRTASLGRFLASTIWESQTDTILAGAGVER